MPQQYFRGTSANTTGQLGCNSSELCLRVGQEAPEYLGPLSGLLWPLLCLAALHRPSFPQAEAAVAAVAVADTVRGGPSSVRPDRTSKMWGRGGPCSTGSSASTSFFIRYVGGWAQPRGSRWQVRRFCSCSYGTRPPESCVECFGPRIGQAIDTPALLLLGLVHSCPVFPLCLPLCLPTCHQAFLGVTTPALSAVDSVGHWGGEKRGLFLCQDTPWPTDPTPMFA